MPRIDTGPPQPDSPTTTAHTWHCRALFGARPVIHHHNLDINRGTSASCWLRTGLPLLCGGGRRCMSVQSCGVGINYSRCCQSFHPHKKTAIDASDS